MPKRGSIVQFPSNWDDCAGCSRGHLCLGRGLPRVARNSLEIHASPRLLHRSQELFRAGEPFSRLFLVRSGALKSFRLTPAGEQQVIDFHLPGDLIGLDAIAGGYYRSATAALDTASVCAISFDELVDNCTREPDFQRQILRRMSAAITKDEEMMVTLGTKTADARVASLLIALSNYFHEQGLSATDFQLPMSRADIGSYLSLAVETVSRVITRLQDAGLIRVNRNNITVMEMDGLRAKAGAESENTARSASS